MSFQPNSSTPPRTTRQPVSGSRISGTLAGVRNGAPLPGQRTTVPAATTAMAYGQRPTITKRETLHGQVPTVPPAISAPAQRPTDSDDEVGDMTQAHHYSEAEFVPPAPPAPPAGPAVRAASFPATEAPTTENRILAETELAKAQEGDPRTEDNNVLSSSSFFDVPEDSLDEIEDAFVGKCLDNRYDIVQHISSGGMGEIYLARQRGVGQEVIVKKLHEPYYQNRKVVERFIDEARSYAKITHPNAVKLHDLLNVGGQICIIMEYVHGKTLTSYIDAGYVFSIRQIMDIGLQMADAVGTVHKAGIIHRDLKSQNIMLVETIGERFSVKILDFGIAKIMDKPASDQTREGIIVGSPQYMSPEQCYGRAIDGRVDIYAFGILLFYMTCGHLPFEADSAMELLHLQIQAKVPPIIRPDKSNVPEGLKSIIHKCMAKDANDRYATFAEVITDIMALQEGQTLPIASAKGGEKAANVKLALAQAESGLSANASTESNRQQFALDAGETKLTPMSNIQQKIKVEPAKRRPANPPLPGTPAAPPKAPPVAKQPVSAVPASAPTSVSAPNKQVSRAKQKKTAKFLKVTITLTLLLIITLMGFLFVRWFMNPQQPGNFDFTGQESPTYVSEFQDDLLKDIEDLENGTHDSILNLTENLMNAGSPEMAMNILGILPQEMNPNDSARKQLIKERSRQYAKMLDKAKENQKTGKCAMTEQMITIVADEAEGIKKRLTALSKCDESLVAALNPEDEVEFDLSDFMIPEPAPVKPAGPKPVVSGGSKPARPAKPASANIAENSAPSGSSVDDRPSLQDLVDASNKSANSENTAAAQPSPTAAQPTTAAAQPSPTAAQPTTAAAQPTTAAAQPSAAPAQPTTAAAQPSSTGDPFLDMLNASTKDNSKAAAAQAAPSNPSAESAAAPAETKVEEKTEQKPAKPIYVAPAPPANPETFKRQLYILGRKIPSYCASEKNFIARIKFSPAPGHAKAEFQRSTAGQASHCAINQINSHTGFPAFSGEPFELDYVFNF